jgi:hypothetical protein
MFLFEMALRTWILKTTHPGVQQGKLNLVALQHD